ncbi:MAG: DUF4855 domain-containing protein [Promethearchaeota archaeon]
MALAGLISALLIPYALLVAWVSHPPGYLVPGDSTGDIRNLVLIYSGKDRNWAPERFTPYVAYLDTKMVPSDSFFDGFLFLAITAQSGQLYVDSPYRKEFSNRTDWEWFLEKLVRSGGLFDNLSIALSNASGQLGKSVTAKVVISIPHPNCKVRDFGNVTGGGRSLDFGNELDRHLAVEWYVTRALELWESGEWNNLEVAGFYWLSESIPASETTLVKSTCEFVHAQSPNLRTFWIPYYFATGYSSWKELGFDCVAYQPNYFFYFWADHARVQHAADRASRHGTGVELEVDDNVIKKKADYLPRFEAYLEAATKNGFSRGFMAYYQEVDTLKKLSESSDPELRALYDGVHEVSKMNRC